MDATYFENKKLLFFDTETTGLAQHKLPGTHPSQPGLVQLGAMTSFGREILTTISAIVDPGGIPVGQKAFETHGISNEKAAAHGFSTPVAVSIFQNMARWADIIICHNNSFDIRVMEASYHRSERDFSTVREADKLCTMKQLTDVLCIPGRYGNKWPTLDEAYRELVDENGFEGAHDAFADIKATYDVFWAAIDKRGVSFTVSKSW